MNQICKVQTEVAQLNSIRTGVVCCVHSSLRVLIESHSRFRVLSKIYVSHPPHRWVASGPMPRGLELLREHRSSSFQRLRPKVAATTSSRTTSERGLLPDDGLEPSAVVVGDTRQNLGITFSNVFKRVLFGVSADRPAFGGRMPGGEGLATFLCS